MGNSSVPDYEFIAYIDEAGDASIKRVRPIDNRGGTEWFVLSAVVVSRQSEALVDHWLAETGNRISDPGAKVLKFAKRSPEQRLIICQHMAELPLRIFTVVSNKRNMRGHRNRRAEKMDSKQWFYNWMIRLLLERVTDYCSRRATRNGLERRHVKFVFSKTGGHSYSQTKAYLEYLKAQAKPVLQYGTISKDVVDWRLIEEFPHFKKSGLQYADIPASAFYQAVDNLDTGSCNSAYAKALEPRMAFDKKGQVRSYGLALQPHRHREIPLGEDQREVFRHYGFIF